MNKTTKIESRANNMKDLPKTMIGLIETKAKNLSIRSTQANKKSMTT